MNAFKERCLELRRAGHTLTEIVRLTGRPKTSVYSHIHNIKLSKGKLELIRSNSRIRAQNLALARKGKSVKGFKRFNNWDENMVSLLAHLIFDGSITRSSCVYNNRNASLITIVEKSMKKIYEYNPNRWTNPLTGVLRISYHNVALSSYLKTKSKELLECTPSLSKNSKKEFIRAFFDDEGCVDFRPKRNLRQIRGYQKNTLILSLIQKLLLNFNIESKIVMPNEIVIRGKENLKKFQEEIGFSSGVRLNENRSNSIWKKPLEKKILLKQALRSFRT